MRLSAPSARGLALGVAAVALVAALPVFLPQTRPAALMRDFNAFYCAGAALDRVADPYRAEPLGSCERTPRAAWLNRGIPNLAAPAPLPPYALAPFALLARLPYETAVVVWSAILIGALVVTIAAIRSLTGLPLLGVAAAFALGDGLAGWTLGQIAPVAVAGIALAAYFIERKRDVAAALSVAIAMLEPHVALPAVLALFVWRPRARIALVGAGLALAAISVAVGGWSLNLEYLHDVLPAHALSEVASDRQLSLTNLAHRLGAGDALALAVGNLSYLVMLVSGIFAAQRVADRTQRSAFIVALPVTLALIGGPFVHVVQVAAALPCAFLLYVSIRPARIALGLAIVALAIPWAQFSSLGTIFPVVAAAIAALLTAEFIARRPLIVASGAAGTILYLAGIATLVTQAIPDPAPALAAAYDPHGLAESSWGLYVRSVATWDVAAFDLARLPTWLALLAIGVLSLTSAFIAAPEVSRDAKMELAHKGELHLDSASH